MTLRFLSTLLILGQLASCALFETKVTRDVRAVWSPDGTSLLLVTSEYTTSNPSENYFYAPSSRSWQVILSTVGSGAKPPFSERTLLDQFDEEVSQGGIAQYDPVYWFPKSSLVVFGGRTGTVRNIDTKTNWRPDPPRAEFEAALGTVNQVDSTLTASVVAGDLELLDLVPSPDGSVVAGLYIISYLVGESIAGDSYEFRVMAFWDVATHALLATRRVTPEIWHLMKSVNPYPELSGVDQNYVWLSWKPDGSGVYAYVFQGTDASTWVGDPPEHPVFPSIIAFVPLSGASATAVQVPTRPVATSSGPVSPTGVAYYLVADGNTTTLQSKKISGWVPFDQIPLEPFSTWSSHASDFNF